MIAEVYAHITLDAEGRAWINGANTKVIEVALDHLVHGWTAEEIHFQHPHLPLGHIHSSLAYYYDHKSEMDDEIVRQASRVDVMEHQTTETPLVSRLRAAGRI